MTSTTWRRRLSAALLLPFLLLAAGCVRVDADFDVKSAELINLSLDFAIEKEYVEGTYSSAEELCNGMYGDRSAVDQVDPEPYEDGDFWGCKAEGVVEKSDFDSTLNVTEEDGNLRLTMTLGDSAITEEDLALIGSDGMEIDIEFTFPGKVIESKGGTVEGNTVTYTDITEFSEGVDITAEAGGGVPWLIVVLVVLVLGFLLLLAIGIGAFFFLRSRKKGRAAGVGASSPYGSSGGSSAVPSPPSAHNAPPAAPQGQQWGQSSPPPAAPQGQQWGQSSPPPAPQGGQQWGQASPPPAPPQGGQAPNQGQQGWNQPPQNQPPQNPGW